MKSTHILFVVLVGLFLFSCRNNSTYSGKTPLITTSLDTLTFDTVFTSVGSVTKSFKIYNKESEDVLVDISLSNLDSPFRLNVNGTAGEQLDDVLIRAKDSIYVFADVTINPNQPLSVSPFIVEQNLKIKSVETDVNVLLSAFGQNANYITPKNKNSGSVLTCDFNTIEFGDPKPYVIYGLLLIDQCNIVLPEGTDVYVHGGVVTGDNIYQAGRIILGKDASIQSNGTLDAPVTFQGDRLDEDYDDLPGQWYGIQFINGSKNNNFKNTVIKNSTYGLQIDSASVVNIINSKILNTASRGIEARHATVSVSNSLIANSYGESIALGYGGKYIFTQNTIANYGNTSSAFIANNYQCNPNDCANTLDTYLLDLTMINNIVVGDAEDEFFIDDASKIGNDLDLNLKNNIVRVTKLTDVEGMTDFFTSKCVDCINYNRSRDKLFVDYQESDYHLDTLSIARDKGMLTDFATDIDGVERDEIFDIGCYESTFK